MEFKTFTIFGERCSGTNYLQQLVETNFHITYRWTPYKHFHCSTEFLKIFDEPNEFYLIIIRNPIDWINSFYQSPHHLGMENKESIYSFLTKPMISYFEMGPLKGEIIPFEKNPYTNSFFQNIFELREVKNYFYVRHIPTLTSHSMWIRYEDLQNDVNSILEKIQKKFELKSKFPFYKKVEYYKDRKEEKYEKRKKVITEEEEEYIWEHVNVEQEKQLGYEIKKC
jgi:hypothetical protein